MKYGYSRVSTQDQSNDKFMEPLINAGVDPAHIVTETISGTKSWRKRKLRELVDLCQPGDSIIVPELSRLGRGAGDVLDLRDELIKRNITVHTLKEGYRIGADMRPADKMVITIMSAVNEMERDFLSERTKEGLAHAKTQGKQLGGYRGKAGRDPGGAPERADKADIMKAIKGGASINGTANRYGVSRPTIYRWLKEGHKAE
jgi:DNA invertase Pin-like site-specific DNA recombinase